MNFLLVAGIVIFGTFLITNVHSGGEGPRNRKLKSTKAAKDSNIYSSNKKVTYEGGYPGAPGTPSGVNPTNSYPDPSFFDDSNNEGGCCRKKKTAHPYYVPDVPIGSLPTTASTDSDAEGFAKKFGLTGGRGGEVVQINTLQDLIQYVGDSTPRILQINSDIEASTLTKVEMGSFKSIVGFNGNAKLNNIYLRATASSQNIIFQNLIFEHPSENKGNDDIQLYLNYGSAYWIDHCSFIGHEWSPKDGSDDKLLYIGEQATGATISHCYFGNHRYGLIFGHPNDNIQQTSDDDTRVTIFNNRFENLDVRAPGLFRFGHYHVYNNYINNYGLGFTVATRGNVISEYNYFGNSPNTNAMLDDKGTGNFMDTGSVPPILNRKSPLPDWTPPYSYNLTKSADPATLQTLSRYVQEKFTPPRIRAPPFLPLVPPPMQFMTPPFPALH